MKTLKRFALLSVALLLAFAGCEDDFGPEHTRPDSGGDLATVTTNNVTSITANSAICGGNVTSDGGNTITARGICWSTSQKPTTEDNATYSGTGIGSFTANITGLEAGTTYYVRAYAVNSKGIAYGTQKAFTTTTTGGGSSEELPTVTTSSVTSITTNSAICGGNVSSDGGSTVTARGVCWSTSQNPTTNDNTTYNGSDTGSFTSNISGLTAGTTYYVRAYAVNSKGTAYGTQKTFTTTTTGGGSSEELPTVTTNGVTSVTENSAVCGGNVTSDGNATVTARGVCWSTSQNPTTNDNTTIDGSGTGSFTSNISGLTAGTTYYVRAYAVNSKGTAYGTQKTFTTTTTSGGGGETITGTINGHDYVDLGLPSGLKWATCNIGASQPHNYGNYYAWGETTTKASYDRSNSVTYGQQISGIISGNVTYDAARANWGSTWRIPTRAEMNELYHNCTWTWTTQNGVNGMRLTGPNGNSIFLPAAGACDGSSRSNVGEDGFYWSSTYYAGITYSAYYLFFSSVYRDVGWCYRSYGCTVRPVSD